MTAQVAAGPSVMLRLPSYHCERFSHAQILMDFVGSVAFGLVVIFGQSWIM